MSRVPGGAGLRKASPRVVEGWTLEPVVGAGWYTGHGWEFQIVEAEPPYWQAAPLAGRRMHDEIADADRIVIARTLVACVRCAQAET